MAILDICAGLGYNSSAAIANFLENSKNTNLQMIWLKFQKQH